MKRCPVCGVEMFETIKYGVEIDVCPKCRGVWLDRGELEKKLLKELKKSSQRSLQYIKSISKRKRRNPYSLKYSVEFSVDCWERKLRKIS